MPKCIAINCKTGKQCTDWPIHATQDSNGIEVYCDKHYEKLKAGTLGICNVGSERLSMSQVAQIGANMYSPRSPRAATSPVSRSVMSPRSSTSYTKPVSPRFQQIVQNDYYGSDNEEEDYNEGFNSDSLLRKKKAIRPKPLFTRKDTSPNFTAKTGSVELLFEIDETDDVQNALSKLQKFKLNVFGADMNTTNKPEDFKERSSVTEDIVNKTAKILSEYMNNPMRIELVLSFIYDYDTRDLDVTFGYFGFRKPHYSELLNTTLDSYIREHIDDDWYKIPTPDIRVDYDQDKAKREKIRIKISNGIKGWNSSTSNSYFNAQFDKLKKRIEGPRFKYTDADEMFEDLKNIWDDIKSYEKEKEKQKGKGSGKGEAEKSEGETKPESGKAASATTTTSTSGLGKDDFKNFVKKLKTLDDNTDKKNLQGIPNAIKTKIINKIKTLMEANAVGSFNTVMKSTDNSVSNINGGITNFLKKIGEYQAAREFDKFNELVKKFDEINSTTQIPVILAGGSILQQAPILPNLQSAVAAGGSSPKKT